MKTLRKFSLLAALAATGLSIACEPPPDPPGAAEPRFDDWQTVANYYFDPSAVSVLNVGSEGTSGQDVNFKNQGKIEVFYTLDDPRIVVQMRRFTFAANEDEYNEDMDSTQAHMYAEASPSAPEDSDPEANCLGPDGWLNSCYIRMYYVGLSQKARVGADFRVFLPKGWEGDLNVVTNDYTSLESETFPRHGDVTVYGAAGDVSVTTDQGAITVVMDANVEPSPGCTAENNQACADLGWDTNDPGCTCTEFGRLALANRGERAVDITVDVPAGLWMDATMRNNQPGQSVDDELLCTADIDCDSFTNGCVYTSMDPARPFDIRAQVNKPANSVEGLGFNLQAESGACAEIPTVDGPEEFENPTKIKRGDLVLCNGCADVTIPEAPAAAG